MNLCLILISAVAGGSARTLYVDNGSSKASDSGPGTEQTPFKTLKPATDQAMPGDTVMVKEGVYRERVSPKRGGTKGQPITYAAAPNASVVIRASEILSWTQQPNGTYTTTLPETLFDTLDGEVAPPPAPLLHSSFFSKKK